MPAMVDTIDDGPAEVVTTEDMRKAQRFWISTIGVALVALAFTGITWAANTNNSIDRNRIGHVADSTRIANLEMTQNAVADQLRRANRIAESIAKKLGVAAEP